MFPWCWHLCCGGNSAPNVSLAELRAAVVDVVQCPSWWCMIRAGCPPHNLSSLDAGVWSRFFFFFLNLHGEETDLEGCDECRVFCMLICMCVSLKCSLRSHWVWVELVVRLLCPWGFLVFASRMLDEAGLEIILDRDKMLLKYLIFLKTVVAVERKEISHNTHASLGFVQDCK